MPKRPKKIMILGLDAPIVPRLYKYCKEGKLPAIARVINSGVWAKNHMVPLPTITPPNWSSIVTGAWPSTIGVTDFNVHWPGDPLDRTHGGFYSGDVRAEFVWNAIARAEKKSVVVNYPTTWPPIVEDGYQIGGAGVEINQWFCPSNSFGSEIKELPSTLDSSTLFRFAQHGVEAGAPGQMPRCSMSFSHLFATKGFEAGTAHALPFAPRAGELSPDLITLEAPTGWSMIPTAKKALHTTLVVQPFSSLYRTPSPTWYILVLDTEGKGYDKVVVYDSKDASKPMAELKEGQWSPIIRKEFQTEAGPKKAAFALKLLKLSRDGQDLRLFHTPIYALVSDHGAKATNGPFPPVQRILINAGLQVRNQDRSIDWTKTRAVAQRSVYIYINLKGRDPDGIVEPGEEYRQVQEQVIKTLTEYVDPAIGKKPILFALRKEDARFINIYGDYVGDVVYALSEHFGGQHGAFLPTAEWGLGSLRGLFTMAGPGIKKGIELERNVWCLDMVPTLCYLAGWPIPRDAEGAVIFQALEDPDPK